MPTGAPRTRGEILRDDVLPVIGISVSDAAKALGVTRQTLHRILAGTTGVTLEMAVRLGKFCGNGPDLWIRMQEAHDLRHAERRIAAQLASIETAKVA
jgi:addiction module HigA family antidote